MALTQISTDGIKNGTITGSDLATNVDLVQNQKLRFGNNQELQIYNDGSSVIQNSTSGHLTIRTTNGGSDINLRSADDFFVTTGGDNNHTIRGYSNAQVELYHNVVKKFETTSTGVKITGVAGTGIGDGIELLQTGDTFSEIVGNSARNLGDKFLLAISGKWNNNHVVGKISIETGDDTTNKDNGRIVFHTAASNGNVAERLRIESNGSIRIPGDNQKLQIGGGNDLQIYHSGTHSFIENDTGHLIIRTDNELKLQNGAGTENMAKFIADGAVELYHNHSKKCETYSSGLEIAAGNQLRLPHANASDGNDGTISSGVHGEGLTLVGCTTVSGGNREILHYGRIRPAINNAESIGADGRAYGQIHSIRLFMRYDSNSTGLYIGADDDIRGYHDGTNSYFTNKTGNFNIGNTTASSGNLILTGGGNDISLQAENGEEGVKVKPDSSVELYHDNVKKFETTNTGVQITSNGSQNGLTLVHSNGNTSAILRHVGTGDEGELHLKDGGSTLLYLSGASGGDSNITTGGNFDLEHDSAKLRIGASNDLQLYHDGNDSYIDDAGTGSLLLRTTNNSTVAIKNSNANMARFLAADAVELYHNNVLKFSTLSNGAEVSGHLHLGDNNELRLGNVGSGGDLKIYHDGTNSYLKNLTGWLNIPVSNNGVSIANSDFSESIARFLKDGACELYHNGSKKFETRGDGATVTGRLKQTTGCAFRARATSDGQTIQPNTPTKVVFGTQVYDYGDVYNPSNSRFTAPVDGVYNFSWSVRMGTPTSTPKLDAEIRVNGNSNVNYVNCGYNQQASNNAAWIGSGDMYMSAGDYAELFVDQNTSSSTNLTDTSNANNLDPGNHIWWTGHLIHEV